MRRVRRTDDSGFTLAELLVSMVITSIIVYVLASAFSVLTHTTEATNQRLLKSHDAQLIANYIVTDAQKFERARGVV